MKKIIPIETNVDDYSDKVEDSSNSKDWAMIRAMSDFARTTPQKNLTAVDITRVQRRIKLALLLLPEWGVYFPPYNLARLSAVARAAGYEVKTFDVNIRAWNDLKGKLDFDPWDPSKEFLWANKDTYFKQIHPHCEPTYFRTIEELKEFKPDVVGFSLYYTNEKNSNWMAYQLRKVLPGVKIIAGGPQAVNPDSITKMFYDHIVQGEGEQLLLQILDSYENNQLIKDKILVQPKNIRLDLDNMPFPDYSGIDFSQYQMPNGISSEVSRGCVAKCVFCTEVHFWKYRGRMSGSVLDEIEYQYRTHGSDFVWFIDSLVNGNLKELRAFCLGVVERKLPIKWQGYARCDSRMDLEYYKDLKASGCDMLNYGIESGNQQVLDAMKKNITVAEIEANMRDGAVVGVRASLNFIIGFPSEDTSAFVDTMMLMWRIRNYNILTISPGISMQMSPGSEITDNAERFDISPNYYQGAWITKDLKNNKLVRMIRQKNFLIFLHIMPLKREVYGYKRPTLKDLYNIKFNSGTVNNDADYEKFDYNIIDTGLGVFANTVVNEIWALLRTLYRCMGSYEIFIKNDPELDMQEWGFRLACNYSGYHKFVIDQEGNWSADFEYNYIQDFGPNNNQFDWPDMSFTYKFVQNGKWN